MSKRIVTIGREYGSGGREIGNQLADELGWAFYDRRLIDLASEKTGIKSEILEKADEMPTNPFFMPYIPVGATGAEAGSMNDRLFAMQSSLIRDIADRESAVFVGRCADQVLSGRTDCLNVFIYAPIEYRIEVIKKRHDLTDDDLVRKLIHRTDKNRRVYYQYYSEKRWGSRESHHLLIDSSVFGIEGTVRILKEIVNMD